MNRTEVNCGIRELGLLALLLMVVATGLPSLSQTQKPRPSAIGAKAKVVKKPSSQPLSREFRKSALMAKVAWDQVLDSMRRQDPKDTIQRYRDEADKADASVQADVQTSGDSGTRLCLLRYETSVVEA
jgi:hypothetical protein